jgi:phosphoribosylamine-glycine ligase
MQLEREEVSMYNGGFEQMPKKKHTLKLQSDSEAGNRWSFMQCIAQKDTGFTTQITRSINTRVGESTMVKASTEAKSTLQLVADSEVSYRNRALSIHFIFECNLGRSKTCNYSLCTQI